MLIYGKVQLPPSQGFFAYISIGSSCLIVSIAYRTPLKSDALTQTLFFDTSIAYPSFTISLDDSKTNTALPRPFFLPEAS